MAAVPFCNSLFLYGESRELGVKQKTMKQLFLFIIFSLVAGRAAEAQPFINEIRAFKHTDSIQPPPKAPILFVGSSTFRLWDNFDTYFPGYPTLNRGFGGSTLPEAIYYVNDIIIPYHPKQILIYSGENDLASSDKVTPDTLLQRFKTLFGLIRKGLPGVPVAFVSIKPSPSRIKLREKVVQTNKLIKAFLKKQKKAAFIDVYSKMLNADGSYRPELFKPDMLHMKPEGYAIWKEVILPYLIK
jgi:lysophospholipase L1-like esterase